MEEKVKFDKKKYDYEYRKKNYKEFRAYLTVNEYDELIKYLNKMNISRSDFLRSAFKELLKK